MPSFQSNKYVRHEQIDECIDHFSAQDGAGSVLVVLHSKWLRDEQDLTVGTGRVHLDENIQKKDRVIGVFLQQKSEKQRKIQRM